MEYSPSIEATALVRNRLPTMASIGLGGTLGCDAVNSTSKQITEVGGPLTVPSAALPSRVLVTGAAGFIGMHTSERLLALGHTVVGVDNLNDYYSVTLKEARLSRLTTSRQFRFHRIDIADDTAMAGVFDREEPQTVIHLAAQPGVRYSLINPHAYVKANLQGFINILEGCRRARVEHLVYASSSSVYGGNTTTPFSEHHSVDHPVSLYAATKKANELMAHTYSHLFALPTTGLRFFTVYGPWGRPDMSPMLFARAILDGSPIDVFNHGRMLRDFTYIDDIVEGVVRVLGRPATPDLAFDPALPGPATSNVPYRVFNIGNSQPVPLMDYIDELEKALGSTATKNFLPQQPGDVLATAADTSELDRWIGFRPRTSIQEGIAHFVDWYRSYFKAPRE